MDDTRRAELHDRIRRADDELLRLWLELDGGPDPSSASGTFDVLQVRAGASWYALAVERVDEVLPAVWCQPLPEAPPWVLGSFRRGDHAVPVVDLQRRLGGSAMALATTALFVVVQTVGVAALAVDEVGEVSPVAPGAIDRVPPGLPRSELMLGSVPGVEAESVGLLSVERICSEVHRVA